MGVLADRIAHLFLPNRCMFCGRPVSFDARRCPDCEQQTLWTDPGRCLFCGKGFEHCTCRFAFEWLAAPFFYELGPRKAVIDLKFHENLLNARKLGGDMTDCLRAAGLDQRVDVIVPVPLFWRDFRRRGYNQAAELAVWIARGTGLPLLENGLRKLRSTAKQHELSSAREREANLQGVFRAELPQRFRGGTVLLVDDICTTGNTLHRCAAALKAGGAGLVVCLTAAKTRADTPAGRAAKESEFSLT